MSAAAPLPVTTPSRPPALQWDLFCRVVDNFGDIGVCWRLAAELARRGQAVRLWADDPSALAWMAPQGQPGVVVSRWTDTTSWPQPGDVVVEAFGCDPPAAFVAAMSARAQRAAAPLWLNLEYLSAESYVERSHGLRSPQSAGPGAGLTKWFFYPGFTPATGGLLREAGLHTAQAAFDAPAWRAAHGLAPLPGEALASLFTYPGAPVDRLFDALAAGGRHWCIAAAPGAALRDAAAALAQGHGGGAVRLHALPWLTQDDYDRLLWSADLNCVRGEDSFVRAQWAGRPFLWQIYPQADCAHAAKLEAFGERYETLSGTGAAGPAGLAGGAAAAGWRRWQRAWNRLDDRASAAPAEGLPPREALARDAERWRAHLLESPDLVTQLLHFVQETR